ncbi:MAG: ribosome small subunit-dependent GTPase A [Sphingobacteriales bacterium]|nr:MAG: ribosome small subunit-dependent GTPase A [Sphingobacteriales bacterium]
MLATVYKSTGSWYVVKTAEGVVLQARIKGIFKIDGITSTNPIAVGDHVNIEMEQGAEQVAMITDIYNRRNYINRQSPSHRMHHHIVAANVDQSLMIATLKEPRTSQGFIDRFLIACEAYHVPAMIVFNKTDLYKDKERAKLDELTEMYTRIGYGVYPMSVKNSEGVDAVKELMMGKTSLISGHSGVGKSSFINELLPELALRTKDVSDWSGKGMHTTTFAEMFDLPGGGRIIDTPGIREFGLVDISKQELSHYFPEMRHLIQDCQFNNCLHMNEPDCAVKLAVQEERIHIDRYVSYCTILDSIKEKPY